MTEENLEWGESYFGREHSHTLTCPDINCVRHNLDYLAEEIPIGVRKEGSRLNRPYILTCECPECEIKYWFHISEEEARKFAKDFAEAKSNNLENL